MPDPLFDSRARNGRYHYRVTDPDTGGVYVVVTERPQTDDQVQMIVASVIQDEGPVERGRTRLVLI